MGTNLVRKRNLRVTLPKMAWKKEEGSHKNETENLESQVIRRGRSEFLIRVLSLEGKEVGNTRKRRGTFGGPFGKAHRSERNHAKHSKTGKPTREQQKTVTPNKARACLGSPTPFAPISFRNEVPRRGRFDSLPASSQKPKSSPRPVLREGEIKRQNCSLLLSECSGGTRTEIKRN